MLNTQLDNENPILHKRSNKTYLPSYNEDELLGDSKYDLELGDSSSLGLSYNDCGLTNKSGSDLLDSSNDYESFDEEEIFNIIRSIKDPEYSYSLEDLNVVSMENIFVDEDTFTVSVFFTPTVPHCSQATLIGLMIFVKLYQSLPPYFKIDVQISKGTHNNEDGINKQLLDKERIAAALENPTLVDMINDGNINKNFFTYGFLHGSKPYCLRNIKSQRLGILNRISSHIQSLPSSQDDHNNSLIETNNSISSEHLDKTDDSINSSDHLSSNTDSEAAPGEVTEEDVWKMKAAISQNSTLGIDWVNTLKTLQTSPYCTVSPLTIAYNSALSAAERNCNADLSLSIIEDMKKSDEKVLDAVSYKIAIMTCIKCNRVEDALRLKDELIESGLNIDHGTIRSLLWLLSHNGYGHEALKLFEILQKLCELCKHEKGLIQTDYLNTIESCLMSNMYEDSVEIYNKLKKSPNYKLDPKSLKTLLELAYNTSDSDLCTELYSQAVKEKSFELSNNHYKLIVRTLLMNGNHDLVHTIWKNVMNEPDLFDTALLQMFLESYSTSGDFKNSYDLLLFMDKEMLLRSSQPYLLAIKSCEKCGEWNLAIKILRMAQNKLNKNDIKMYNAVLAVCLVAKEWDAMASIYKEIFKDSSPTIGQDQLKHNELVPDGDTIAYLLISFYHLDDQPMIHSLLSFPIVDTPLLSKIRKSLKQ